MQITQISFVTLNIEFTNAHLDVRRLMLLYIFVRTTFVRKILTALQMKIPS